MKYNPLISVCIPVYNAEKTLEECIWSVVEQNFEQFEIILVNDGSQGTDTNGLTCRKILLQAQKKCQRFRNEHKLSKIEMKYIEHKSNLGLVEARRTAIEYAKGQYICNLDSDDTLLPGALTVLYQTAIQCNADIVQGQTEIFPKNQTIFTNYNNAFFGELEGSQILDGYLVKHNHIGLLWAKLIRRETYLEAFTYIPFTRCVMCEDYLQYFFIALVAKKYVGIKTPVVKHNTDTGISSSRKIETLERWEHVCSTANVFTIIFDAIKKLSQRTLTQEQMEALRLQSRSYLVINLEQLKHNVISSLQEQARQLLCDYWGEDFVEEAERHL